jgi:hypothetical protein
MQACRRGAQIAPAVLNRSISALTAANGSPIQDELTMWPIT